MTIAASGDVLVHQRVVDSARAHDDGFGYAFGPLSQAIEAIDGPSIVLVNLETPLTQAYISPLNANPPVLGAPPELAKALVTTGIDVVSVANNHAMDQTVNGLADTVQTSRDAGLGVVGAGHGRDEAYQPWITEQGGLRVGYLGFAGHVNAGPGGRTEDQMQVALLRHEEDALAAITRLRAQVDVVVVAAHWSHDFVTTPLASQRSLARRMVDAGADLILGTGPHVLQQVERLESPRGQALVAYSLGNLISNQGLRYQPGHRIRADEHPVAITPGTRDAVLLAAKISSPEAGRVEIESVEATVFWVENNFWERRLSDEVPVDIHLSRLRDVDEALRTERLAAVGETLGSAVVLVP